MIGPNASHALDYAAAQHKTPTRDWTGLCLAFVRSSFGAPAMGGDAHSAWDAAKVKHRADGSNPPRGVPIFWRGGAHGHTADSAGGGKCWTTDFVRPGHVDLVSITAISSGWNLVYRGWTEDVNGVRVTGFAAPGKPTRPKHAGHRPFVRTIRPGMRGPDVRDLKQHLWGRDVLTNVYGPVSVRKVKQIQRRAGDLGKPDGVVGPVSWRRITGHR